MMSITNLPDIVLLKIFEYLPFEDCIRARRVSHRFREPAEVIVSKTKHLNLNDRKFERLTPIGLASLVNLCKNNLGKVSLSKNRQLAASFSEFCCPRLIRLDMNSVECGADVFGALMKNNQNLRYLIWQTDDSLMEYPRGVVGENLLKLVLRHCDGASLATLSGHCPNLRELDIDTFVLDNGKVLDEFFANAPKLEEVFIDRWRCTKFGSLIHFWRLTSLRLLKFGIIDSISSNDNFLVKISESFPQLKSLDLPFLNATNAGITALAALPNLCQLKLGCSEDNEIDASVEKLAKCGRLEELILAGSILSTATFMKLFRFCPNLGYLRVQYVDGVDSADALIGLFRHAVSFPGRSISVVMHFPSPRYLADYANKRIRDFLDEIANAGGRRIRYVDWQFDKVLSRPRSLLE